MRRLPRKRTKVVFLRRRPLMAQQADDAAAATVEAIAGGDELPMATASLLEPPGPIAAYPGIPSLFTEPPPIKDTLITETSQTQDEIIEDCLPLHAGAVPAKTEFDDPPARVLRLERHDHAEFLTENLQNAKYIPYDAARPWVVYWCLTGLSVLGKDVTQYRQRVLETFTPAQNRTGGFGGGHGQLSHVAPSYAAVLSLAMVGGKEAYDLIDRRSLWRWLGHVKQADGGFKLSIGGEEDIRGAYCSLVMIALLALPPDLPSDAPACESGLCSLLDGLPEYLSRCQTYEGGISGAPQTEAHGAYAFCALASLCILGPPGEMERQLDLPLLISWLAARQYAPEGGFSGRTNKLVDGCYSHWVGGCWPLLEAALCPPYPPGTVDSSLANGLYHREGLIRYVLTCCQHELGGLRDKPSTRPDAYHSCYVLAGLSSTQYQNVFQGHPNAEAVGALDAPFRWASNPRKEEDIDQHGRSIYDPDDLVEPIHPVFVIPWKAVNEAHSYFSSRVGF